ncbi:uncharacterized protein LOC141651293 [Silene latifolia]|uniref:uncharacterized protein LOC141651293 n=1 Tax=Silene latifolia TaxID=37657 RepID=UPI003D77AE41
MSSRLRKHESGTPLNETTGCDENFDNPNPFVEEDIIEENYENNDVQSDGGNTGNHVVSDSETEKATDYMEKFGFDIFDPRNWDALDSKMVDVIVEEGLKRDMTIDQGPKDDLNRFFSSTSYNKLLPNGEKCDKDWLVYSKELDRVFCFCCKVFSKGCARRGRLAMEGFDSLVHLSGRLKEHESSLQHIQNMTTWYDLRLRLRNNQTIDSINQSQIKKEKEHWNQVLLRIISIVKFLAKVNLAF